MALQKQNASVSFLQGIDQKTDSKQVVPGKLLALENGVFIERGKIKKRNGYQALSRSIDGTSPSSISTGSALANYANELLLFSGSELYSYSTSMQRWADKGPAVSLGLSVNPIFRNTSQQTTQDCAVHSNGLQLFTFEDTRGGARYSVIDSATGQSIVSDVLIGANASKPKPIVIGNYFIVLYYDTTLQHLRYISIPIQTPSSPGSAVDVATNINTASPNFDATLLGSRLFIAYNNNDVGHGVSVKYIDPFLIQSAVIDVTTENASTCIGIFGDAVTQQIWVAYYNGTALRYFVRDYSLSNTAVLAPTTGETTSNVVNVGGTVVNGVATVFYSQSAAATYNYVLRKAVLSNTGTVISAGALVRSVGIAAKPFLYNGTCFVTVAYESTLQPTYFLLSSVGRVVAKFCPSVGGGLPKKNILPEANSVGASSFLIACLQKDLLTTQSGAIFTQTGVGACTLDFSSGGSLLKAELGNNLQVSGGIMSMYDGAALVEHGFHLYPENVSGSTSATGGSIGAGQYQYSVCYEWVDNQGQTHRSAPSVPVTLTTTGTTSTNTITIPTLRLTAKHPRSPVMLVVYRTQANGTTFYQISSVTSPTLNSINADTITYTDTAADASIIGNPLLYTTGGVLENIAVPAVNAITTYRSRVVYILSEDPLSFGFSKKVIHGTPVEFSDFLVRRVDQLGGGLTAVADLDGNLILFKNSHIFFTAGDGPTDAGTSDDIPEPKLIPTDSGCTNPRSVVLTPSGLMYKSQKGIYLLDRSLQVQYVGAGVEGFNSDEITSATLIPNTNQVRFCLSSGVALVYDYVVGEWAVFTNHNAVDAVNWNKRFTYLRADGKVYHESDQFTDDGQFVKLRIVTSWLSFAGLQGFQRVYKFLILGEYLSAHKLLVKLAYDFDPTFTQEDYIDATTLIGPPTYGSDATYGASAVYGGNFPLYQWRVNTQKQKCQSIQISIEDIQSSNFGEGFSISALGFEVGAKAGLNKISAKRSFG